MEFTPFIAVNLLLQNFIRSVGDNQPNNAGEQIATHQ